ncbi:MAG: ATP-binding cassette domain-containing protein [Ruminococcus sp.]|nr:ATP-binding cassette domain-containing protein [Ruminococcus sp.]
MLEVKSISKRYGAHKALDSVSFKADDGEIVGLLGANGAGKSTAMNIITGYISANSGSVSLDGKDILENAAEARKDIGYLPEIPPLYTDMTVKEYLYFIYDLKKCRLPKISHMKDICSLVKIDDVYNRLIKNLSKGYRQRVGFAQALVGDPKTLILDEPTVGLDPKQIVEVRSLIKKLGKRHTVILSSHILTEVQAVCDRIVIIDKGKVIADDTEKNILAKHISDRRLFVTVEGAQREKLRIAFEAIAGVKKVAFTSDSSVQLTPSGDNDIRRAVFETVAENGWVLLEMRSGEPTLEDIFMKLTHGEENAEEEVS